MADRRCVPGRNCRPIHRTLMIFWAFCAGIAGTLMAVDYQNAQVGWATLAVWLLGWALWEARMVTSHPPRTVWRQAGTR